MNEAVKERWVSALRSDRFRQGERALGYQTDEGDVRHCCLGVLCELAIEDGVIEKSQRDGGQFIYGAGALAYLPDAVIEWAGLESESPTVPLSAIKAHGDAELNLKVEPDREFAEGYGISLTSLNDHGVSFRAIADLIDPSL